MKLTLVDTDILSPFLRKNPIVFKNISRHDAIHGVNILSIITYYEIVREMKYRDAKRQLPLFEQFVAQNNVINLSTESVTISAEISAQLRTAGTTVADADLLIAGVAIANNLRLATHNVKHFGRIPGLELIDWSETIE